MDENPQIRPATPISDIEKKDVSKEGSDHILQISQPLQNWLAVLSHNPGIAGLIVEQLDSNPNPDEDQLTYI